MSGISRKFWSSLVLLALAVMASAGAAPGSGAAEAVVLEAGVTETLQVASITSSLAQLDAVAEALIAQGAACDEMSCPQADCGAIKVIVDFIVSALQFTNSLRVLIDQELASGSGSVFFRDELTTLRTRTLDTTARLREAAAAIISCATSFCRLGVPDVPLGSVRFDSWAAGSDILDAALQRSVVDLRALLAAIEIVDACPGVEEPPRGGTPGDPYADCPQCAEAARNFAEAEQTFRRLQAAAWRDDVSPQLAAAAEAARDEALYQLLRCQELSCPNDPIFPPSGAGGVSVSLEARCFACQPAARALESSRLARDWARQALDRAIAADDDPAVISRLEEALESVESSVRQATQQLLECESRCASSPLTGTDEFGLLFADNEPYFTPGAVDRTFNDPDEPPPVVPPGPSPFDPRADLSITKVDSADPVEVGETFTYEITVQNNGPDFANDVVVEDLLPEGLTAVNTEVTLGMCGGGGSLRCDIVQMIPGARSVITITVIAFTDPGELSNTATVTGLEPDPDANNNTATETTTVVAPPPAPALCPLGFMPGDYEGNNGLGIGMAAVSCTPNTVTIAGPTITLLCDGAGSCGDNNTFFGRPNHRAIIIGEGPDSFRINATELDANGDPTGSTGSELLTFSNARQ